MTDWATGAVGVAGIAATYLTGRSARKSAVAEAQAQRDAEREQRLRDQRQACYLRLLAILYAADRELIEILHHAKAKRSRETSSIFFRVATDLDFARGEVRLVAPREVRAASADVGNDVIEAMKYVAAELEIRYVDRAARDRLLFAMKKDLGFPLDETDLNALDVDTTNEDTP